MFKIIDYIKNKENFILYIYCYMFLLPWNFFKWQMGALTIILFIWWLIKYKSKILTNLKSILIFKPLLILIIFIVYSYVSILWSDSLKDGFDHVNKFHKYYIFVILPLFLSLKPNEAVNCIKLLVLSIGVYAIFSVSIYLGLFSIEGTHSNVNNPKGIMAYAIMSIYMGIAVFFGFFIASFSKAKNEIIVFYSLSILCLFTLFINNSRTAQLAFLLSLFIIIIVYFRKSIFKIKSIFIILIIFSAFVFSSFELLKVNGKFKRYVSAYNETLNIIDSNKYEGSFGLRVYFNAAGIDIFKEEPIFGSGPEDNIEKFIRYQNNDPLYTNDKIFSSFHSQHIDLLTRYGLVGYLLIIGSAIYLMLKLRSSKKLYYIALSFFLVVFFSSLANVMLIKKPFNYIYITIFVLFSVIAYKKNKDNKEYDYLY